MEIGKDQGFGSLGFELKRAIELDLGVDGCQGLVQVAECELVRV